MSNLPYITAPGNIDKALTGIRSAQVPTKVTQDFVKTILQIPGGSGDQMTTFLRKIGFASGSGEPSDLYRKYRNPTLAGSAVAAAVKTAYAALYVRNEFMHRVPDAELVGLIVEETGQPADSSVVRNIASCIRHLKLHANFDDPSATTPTVLPEPPSLPPPPPPASSGADRSGSSRGIGLNLGYTINLNLPATADPEVFDAIFKSLKRNLLSEDDA